MTAQTPSKPHDVAVRGSCGDTSHPATSLGTCPQRRCPISQTNDALAYLVYLNPCSAELALNADWPAANYFLLTTQNCLYNFNSLLLDTILAGKYRCSY